DRDDRYVDLREDIGRHDDNCRDAEQQNQRGQDVERMWEFQCEANNTHTSAPFGSIRGRTSCSDLANLTYCRFACFLAGFAAPHSEPGLTRSGPVSSLASLRPGAVVVAVFRRL